MSAMTEFYVYQHTFLNGSVYVGKGKGRRAHSLDRKRLPKWWATYTKYGAPDVKIVEKELNEAQAVALEISLISRLRSAGVALCNLTDGGEGLSGYVVSIETKEKLRAANLGRVVSLETRQKIKDSKANISDLTRAKLSAAHTGKVQSADTKRKRSVSLTGRPVSSETRARLRESNLGWKHGDEAKSKMRKAKKGKIGEGCPSSKIVLCSNGMRFFGTFEAQRWLRANGFEKASAARVAAVCRGERNKAYSFIWRYA